MITAYDLFAQNGIKSVSMDDIARSMGISKRTIYEFYTDKEDLLCRGIVYTYNRFKKLLSTYELESETVIEAILGFYHELIKHPKCYNKKFYADLKRYPRAMEIESLYKSEFSETCRRLFDRGVKEGVFLSEINFELVTLIANKHINMLEPSKAFSSHSLVEIYSTVVYLFLRGISTVKGQEIIRHYALTSKVFHS